MLKKSASFEGYILLESCLAFMVVTILLLESIPLIVSVRQFQQTGQQRLEVYRYFSELAADYQRNGSLEFKSKTSNQTLIQAEGALTKGRVRLIRLKVGEESHEIEWLGGDNVSQE